MKKFSRLFTPGKLLLILSVTANIALLLVCTVLFSKLKTVYVDYRHFRGLPVGVSMASTTEASTNSVVLFGDSRVAIWDPLPSIQGKNIINAGVTGETTSEMRRRFDHDVLRLKPHTVIIQAGINDLTAYATRDIPEPHLHLERMHKNIEFFVSSLSTSGARVILTSIIPNNNLNPLRKVFWHTSLTDTVSESNRKLELLAEKYQVTWLDINDVFVDNKSNIRGDLYTDTLHIKPLAYKEINEIITGLL